MLEANQSFQRTAWASVSLQPTPPLNSSLCGNHPETALHVQVKNMEETSKLEIRISEKAERTEIENIHKKAFGRDKGREIADLVNGLFEDKTAMPLLSMVAVENGKLIGHILYTKGIIAETDKSVSVQLLAPLAVIPEAQKKGVGGRLINEGLERLKKSGTDLVFVLGHPGYYPRCGFVTAGRLGFEAPYPIPDEHADAWMVQELKKGIIGNVTGKFQCPEVLNQPEHWRE
ncbi:GNAT family acetyltransferase [Candidatus Magnetomorum sp. HK-1]|nr:GNAT family acetyltransferase [Candidatus Magnetomorum sp. HK-1]